MIHFDRMLNTDIGRFFISLMLGLGLATLFRKACNDKNCIVFNGPVISEIDGKTYKFGEVCYKYKLVPAKCNPNKKVVELGDLDDLPKDGVPQGGVPVTPETKSDGKGGFFSSLFSSKS